MTCSKFLLGFQSKFSCFEMIRADPKTIIKTAKAKGSPLSPQGASRGRRCLLETFVSGLTTPPAKRNDNVNQKTIWINPNSSLVSGFDVSTENEVDFKRLRDKKLRCTIPCEGSIWLLPTAFLDAVFGCESIVAMAVRINPAITVLLGSHALLRYTEGLLHTAKK